MWNANEGALRKTRGISTAFGAVAWAEYKTVTPRTDLKPGEITVEKPGNCAEARVDMKRDAKVTLKIDQPVAA